MIRLDRARKPDMLGKKRQKEKVQKQQRTSKQEEPRAAAGRTSSKTFKMALTGEELGSPQEGSNCQFIHFLYVESSTKD